MDQSEKNSQPVDIILICDHRMVQQGFLRSFEGDSHFTLSQSHPSIGDIRKHHLDLGAKFVLICYPCNNPYFNEPENDFAALKYIYPNSHWVIINSDGLEDAKKSELISLGVKGFLPRSISPENMKKAFGCIQMGEIWVSRKITDRLLNRVIQNGKNRTYKVPENQFQLSNREMQILQALGSGLTNAEIGDKLFISEKTVKAHINHIFKKMGVNTRTQAVLKAIKSHYI